VAFSLLPVNTSKVPLYSWGLVNGCIIEEEASLRISGFIPYNTYLGQPTMKADAGRTRGRCVRALFPHAHERCL
jgi:hypothetical protein